MGVQIWLEETGSLKWLCFAGVGLDDKASDSRLPSWAPNYNLYPTTDGIHGLFFEAGHADRAVPSVSGAVPRLLKSVFTTSTLLGPAILQSDKQIPGTSFKDPEMFTFLCELMSDGSGVRGVRLLRAIHQVHPSFVPSERTDEWRIMRAAGILHVIVCYSLDRE
jgi:hypothetical protein